MISLRDYQTASVEQIRALMLKGQRRICLVAPTGCHRAGQSIMLSDGTTKMVEDVRVGDLLMGPDSQPRRVLNLCRGRGPMVQVTPTKGIPFVVNEDHILTLVRSNDGTGKAGEVVDVSVREYLCWSKTAKHIHKLFRPSFVVFPKIDAPPLDPYFVGILLGDGCLTQGVVVCKPDEEIASEMQRQAEKHGLAYERKNDPARPGSVYHRISCPRGTKGRGRESNPIRTALHLLGMHGMTAGTKRIPDAYKYGTIQSRKEVLAGLLDTDGHLQSNGFDFISLSMELTADVVFVARSLGLAAYMVQAHKDSQFKQGGTYWRASISGHTDSIPTRIARKRASPRKQVKDVLRTGFTVERLDGEEDFYGFTLSGDGRYLMGDFTVTHNSGKGSTIAFMIHGAAAKGKRVLFLVAGRQLVDEFSQRLDQQLGVEHGVMMAGHWRHQPEASVQVASVDTLASHVRNGRTLPPADLVILDEADLSVADRFTKVLERYPQAFVIGMTATPIRADGKGLGRLFGELVVAATPGTLIQRGYLAKYDGVALISRMTEEEEDRAARSDDGAQSVWDALEDRRKSQIVGDCVQEWVAHVGIGSRRTDGVVRDAPAPTVGFAMTRDHSREIVKAFNDARRGGAPVGVAVHIDGDTKLAERDRVHEAMRAGEVHVVSNVGVMGRGVDWPLLEVCAFWRPTQSLALHLQMAGRVLRPHPGKIGAFYLDHVGNFSRHGLPDDDREWSLEDGEEPGRDVTRLEPTTTCRKCAAVFLSGRPCPRCGTMTQAKPRALPEKVAGEAVSIRDVKRELPEDVRMERALYALIAVGIRKGLPPMWGAGVWSRKWKQPMPDGAKVNRIAAQIRARS